MKICSVLLLLRDDVVGFDLEIFSFVDVNSTLFVFHDAGLNHVTGIASSPDQISKIVNDFILLLLLVFLDRRQLLLDDDLAGTQISVLGLEY